MNKVYFNLEDFPKLISTIRRTRVTSMKVSEILIELGFKSAGFDRITERWYVVEHEYTWLVLRFS